MSAIITFMSAMYSVRSGYGRSSSELLNRKAISFTTRLLFFCCCCLFLCLFFVCLFVNQCKYCLLSSLYKHILVHVVFLGVDMDYSIHHLAPISCVWRHVLGVLIVVGVCLWNRWVDGGIWEKRGWIIINLPHYEEWLTIIQKLLRWQSVGVFIKWLWVSPVVSFCPVKTFKNSCYGSVSLSLYYSLFFPTVCI